MLNIFLFGIVIIFGAFPRAATAESVTFDVSGRANLYQQTDPGTINGSIDPVRVPDARLCPGQTIEISATGCVVDFGPRCTSPVGYTDLFRGLPAYSLIGRWSSSPDVLDNSTVASDPFFVGTYQELTAPTEDGEYYLFLGENDGNFTDNSGAYEVTAEWTQFSSCTLHITTESLAVVQIGNPFTQELETLLGEPPFAWSVVGGMLPAGVDLSADGVLEGTPTEIGEFPFTARVDDGNGDFAEKELALEIVTVLPPPDLQILVASTTPVPGRTIDNYIAITNKGAAVATDFVISAFLEPWFSFVSAEPDPSSSLSREDTFPTPSLEDYEYQVEWHIPPLDAGETTVIIHTNILDPLYEIGDSIFGGACENVVTKAEQCLLEYGNCGEQAREKCIEMGVSYIPCIAVEEAACTGTYLGCLDEANVLCGLWEQFVTGPIDPNEKLVVAERFIQPDQTLVYPIHFENIGDVEALDVFVTDILDANLDDSTLELLTPDGATYDPVTRTVRWDLLGRNLLPGETDNVLLSVRPVPGLASGTEIPNVAEIQFEIFDPLVTPEVVNIIDSTKPNCEVDALPAVTSTEEFTVSWTGTDEVGEIEAYAVFVSTDGGGWVPFLAETTETSAQFTGEDGSTYEFLCAARDTAGNTEEDSLVPEATTTVTVVTNQPPEASPSADPDSGAAPLTVQFMANASDVNGDPLTYAWDFGDPGSSDNTSSEENPTHVYTQAGDYTAELTVSDGAAEASASVVVEVLEPLTVSVRSARVVPNFRDRDVGAVSVWLDFDAPLPSGDDLVSVSFDGIELFSEPFSGFRRGLRSNVYLLFQKHLVVQLNLDNQRVFVLRRKADLGTLDNSDGVDVDLTLGDTIGTENIIMTEGARGILRYR